MVRLAVLCLSLLSLVDPSSFWLPAGVRTQLATCCQLPWNSPGCTTSLSHVFKETEVSDLHRRVAFKTTEEVQESYKQGEMGGIGIGGGLEVGAMDCEMFVSRTREARGRKGSCALSSWLLRCSTRPVGCRLGG